MASAAEKRAALNTLNRALSTENEAPKNILSSVSAQLGGDNHPYGFDRTDPEYVLLLSSSAAAIATDATKYGIRCWDDNGRQIIKEELAARVFATHKNTLRESEWFEPSIFGANAGEYWKPRVLGLFNGALIVLTMFGINYGRAYYARVWNCHWPTITNFGGILDTPFCAGLKWVDTIWNGIQQSFVYGGAAAVAYAIPSMFGWRPEARQFQV